MMVVKLSKWMVFIRKVNPLTKLTFTVVNWLLTVVTFYRSRRYKMLNHLIQKDVFLLM